MTARFPRLLTVPLACLMLSGCLGGLLGGGKPAELFRFGSRGVAPEAAGTVPAATRSVLLAPAQFAPEVEGDRLLASEGAKTLYIKGARWVAPVPALFEQSLRDGFRTRTPWIAIGDRRAATGGDQTLQIVIDRFEAQYPAPGAVPTILIAGQATLLARGGLPIARYRLHQEQAAAANDLPSIVAAFDAASAVVVVTVVDWTSATPSTGSAPAAPAR